MKLLLIMYAGASPDHVRETLAAHSAGGYTELDGARGAGQTGRVEGTRAWPGSASLFLTAVAPERAAALEAALKDCAGRCEPGERLHVATLPVDRFF